MPSPARCFSVTSRTARCALLVLFAALTACAPPTTSTEPAPAPTPRPAMPDSPPEDDAAPMIEPGSRTPIVDVTDPLPIALGPRLSIEPGGGVLRGRVELRVTARDVSPIETLRFVEPAPLVARRPDARVVEGGFAADLTATLDTAALPDGPLTITVRSVNRAGHETLRSARFTVSNDGPTIRWIGAADGAVLRGTIVFEAEASDADGVQRFSLDDPELVDLDPAPDRIRVSIDTRMWRDGRHRVAATAVDAHGNIRQGARTLIVDNNPDRILEGSVWFGGPVIGARVRVYGFGAGGFDGLRLDRCPAAGCSTDGLGGFRTVLRDSHNDAVRIRVLPDVEAETLSLDPDAGALRVWPHTARLSALIPHAAAGPVRIHGVTTLLDATVTARVREGQALEPALALARALWAEHTCDGCDPAATQPLGAGGHRDLTPAVQLGLVHGGLFRLAAWQTATATALGEPLETTTWALMDLLRRDLTDGLLDGFRLGNDLTDDRVGPFTLRGDLAAAVDQLLAERPEWLDMPRALLRGEAGWLEAVAGRRSPLWRAEPAPEPLDTAPPVINIISPAPGSAHNGELILVAMAEDDGVPPTLHLIAPDGIPVHPTREPGRIEARVMLGAQPEGPVELTVIAEDAVGHLSEATVVVHVDHTPPELTLSALDGAPFAADAVQFTRVDRFSFIAQTHEPDVVVEIDHPAVLGPLGDGMLVVVVDGYGPGRQPIQVSAVDPAGNRATVGFDLHWQAEGPGIEVITEPYTPAHGYSHRDENCRPLPEDPRGPEICDLRLETERNGTVWFAAGDLIASEDRAPLELRILPIDAAAWNPPRARVRVNDDTGRGLLERRVLTGEGVWSDWQVVDVGAEGFPIDLAQPQTPRPDAGLRSTIEDVEFRATDAVGHVTVRALRWRRRVMAPPVGIRQWDGFAERDTVMTPGGYGFSPGDRPLGELTASGNGTVDGVYLGMWRAYNPWPVPVVVGMNTHVWTEHRRSRAYRQAGLVAGRPGGCGVGAFYLGAAGGERESDCAASPWALVASGERVVSRSRQLSPFVYIDPVHGIAALPEAGVLVPPGAHRDVYLRPELPDVQLLPGYEVEVPDSPYLFTTLDAVRATLRLTAVERDTLLRWETTQINFWREFAHAPDDSGLGLPRFDPMTIEHLRPQLEMPQGVEQR